MELAEPARLASRAAHAEGRVTDGDLLERIADGDNAAFETLYRRFARPLYGLALRMLRSEPVPGRTTTAHKLITAANVFMEYPPYDLQ